MAHDFLFWPLHQKGYWPSAVNYKKHVLLNFMNTQNIKLAFDALIIFFPTFILDR